MSAQADVVRVAHLRHYTAQFREWGHGRPIVLVPGLAGGMDLLGPLARCLAHNFRVIAYQLRGEDDCFALRRRFDLADLVNDLREFLDWRGLERPVVLGMSFGGVLAMELAARDPHRLGALVVQGAGSRFEKGLIQWVAGRVLSRYPLPSDNPFVNQFFNLLFGGRQKPGPLFEFVTRSCWATDQSVMAHRFKLVQNHDIRPRLSQVRAPALVLTGDRDLLVSRGSLSDLSDGLPAAKMVTLPRAGHLASVTHPALVAEEVTRFVRSH